MMPSDTRSNAESDLVTPHWSRIGESGTLTGIRFLFALYRLLGRRVMRVLLIIVSAYFTCTRQLQRRASRNYLATHARYFPSDWPTPPGLRHSFYHFFQFAEAVLDKTIAWDRCIDETEFTVVDPDSVRDTLADQRGQLIIGTHFGNLEYCRGFIQGKKNKVINILIHDRHSANFTQAMEQVNPESRLNIYQVEALDLNMILALKAKVDVGEWLFIAGDRQPVQGIHRTVAVQFLGRTAAFPIGPYQLARTLGCPVKLMFAYRKNKKIIFDLVPFADKIEVMHNDRAQTISHYASKFAFELEKRCKEAPFQWFNFYDFWAPPYHTEHHPGGNPGGNPGSNPGSYAGNLANSTARTKAKGNTGAKQHTRPVR